MGKVQVKDVELYVNNLRKSYDSIKAIFHPKNHKCDPNLGDEPCAECEEWFQNDMAIDSICDNAMINAMEL